MSDIQRLRTRVVEAAGDDPEARRARKLEVDSLKWMPEATQRRHLEAMLVNPSGSHE
jgi:hypothetical protein